MSKNFLPTLSRVATMLIVLFNILHQPALAQQFQASMSPVFKLVPGITSSIPLGADHLALDVDRNSGGFGFTFNLSKAVMSIKIVRYDSTLKVVKEYSLSNGEKLYGPFSPQLKKFGDKIYVIYYTYNPGNTSLKLFLANINPETLVPDAATEIMNFGQANVGLFKAANFENASTMAVTLSPNKQHLLVTWTTESNHRFFSAVFDKDLKLEWKKEIDAIKGGKIFEFNACVDNQGVAYASFRYDIDAEAWAYMVTAYNGSGKLKENIIKTKAGKVYQSLVIAARSGESINVVGSYSEHPRKLNGLFHQTISTTGYVLNAGSQTPFAESLVEQVGGEGWASTREKYYGLDDLRLVGYELTDGSLALAGEWSRVADGSRASTLITGSVLNARIKDGKMLAAIIPKRKSNAGFIIADSYTALPCGNKLLVFYNDNPDNLERDPLKPSTSSNQFRQTVMAIGYLAEDGTIKRQKVLDNSDDLMPIGQHASAIAENQFRIPMLHFRRLGGVGNESRWGIVLVQ